VETFVQARALPGEAPAFPAAVGADMAEVSGTAFTESAASMRWLMALRSWYRCSCQLPSMTMITAATTASAAAPSQRGVSRNRYTP
jgi:hypothetical protein